MSLLLPILLLGFAQPVEQPSLSTVPQHQAVQAGTTAPSADESANLTDHDRPRLVPPFDRIEPALDKQDGKSACLTMRSYYFERRDSLAPELKGMTTCEDVRQVRNRNARKRAPAELVPANKPLKNQ